MVTVGLHCSHEVLAPDRGGLSDTRELDQTYTDKEMATDKEREDPERKRHRDETETAESKADREFEETR